MGGKVVISVFPGGRLDICWKEKDNSFLDLDIYLEEENQEQDELTIYLEEKQVTRNVS